MWLLLVPEYIFAQRNDSYQFSHLDIKNGLSDNQVNCIFKDQKGFMWFGTTSGLNRYDGNRFKIFKHDAKDVNSLAENHVLTVLEGPDEKLWVFTHSNISVYDPKIERFSNDLRKQLSYYNIPAVAISSIKKDINGAFWFLVPEKGLYRYNPKDKKTVFYSNQRTSATLLHSNAVVDVTPSSTGDLWIIYSDGFLERLDPKANKIISRFEGIAKSIINK